MEPLGKLSDVEHDLFVKGVDAGESGKTSLERVGDSRSRKPRSSRLSGPGWAQQLTNDSGRLLRELRVLDGRLRSLENLFRQFVSAPQADGESNPYGVSVAESLEQLLPAVGSAGGFSSDSIKK